MDKIEIKGLEVFAHHGVYEEEQRLGQKFVVSAVLSLDTTAAAQTDDLDKTVNYGAISRQITQILQRENHKLLERAAAVTAEEILLTNPLINGIKEASGNISQVAKVAALCGDALNIYSGNDDQVVPLLALGGKGVISVVSNVAPELVHNCCQAFFDRDTAKACALQLEMLPLEEALFCEVNPIPVKYAMNVLGWNAGECRLPLVEPSDAHKAKIEQALLAAGLIKE